MEIKNENNTVTAISLENFTLSDFDNLPKGKYLLMGKPIVAFGLTLYKGVTIGIIIKGYDNWVSTSSHKTELFMPSKLFTPVFFNTSLDECYVNLTGKAQQIYSDMNKQKYVGALIEKIKKADRLVRV